MDDQTQSSGNTLRHTSVMLRETLDMLHIKPGGIYIDGTLGGGGHTNAILQACGSDGRVIGIDRDPYALERAARLSIYGDRFLAVHGNFHDMEKIARTLALPKVDGILLDLGVSSFQLDQKQRGFSYQEEAPLDMRMDPAQPFTAWDVVNGYDKDKLAGVISEYGEERWAARIAEFIVAARPVNTTTELVKLICDAVPASARRDGPHPARRTYQAIRIEVNAELAPLAAALEDMIDLLAPQGRLVAISFHSLEDRIVKQTMQRWVHPCTCPPKAPICVCGKQPLARVLTRKPLLPSDSEILENPRARSAKMRAAERLAY